MEAGILLWVEETRLLSTQENPQSPAAAREGKEGSRGNAGQWEVEPLTSGTVHAALTCSTSPREPAGPLPTRAAGIARPCGSQPRAMAIGSPVDGSVVSKGSSEGSQHGVTLVKPSSERMHPAHIICLWLSGQHHSLGSEVPFPSRSSRGSASSPVRAT